MNKQALMDALVDPTVPGDKIESMASESVDRALSFYAGREVALNYTPRILYTGELYKPNPISIAAVHPGESFTGEIVDILGVVTFQATMERKFGINLSTSAIEESLDIAMANTTHPFTYDADIALFAPISTDLDDIDVHMAHEVWHLIEKERDVFHGLICEGTATYAMNQYGGRISRWPAEGNFFNTIRSGGAYIASQEVRGDLPKILDAEIRTRMTQKFNQLILPRLHGELVDIMTDPVFDEVTKENVHNNPDYKEFRRNPSPETLIQAERNGGYHRFADELASQDITRMFEYYRGLLHM